jgi:hypothetical protein
MKTLLSVFNELKQTASKHAPLSEIKSKSTNSTWVNLKFETDRIRYGHLEYFKADNDKVEVVHSTCYPQFDIPLPIFGFDIIALNKKVTGIFCDITPAPNDHADLRSVISSYYNAHKNSIRTLPEWANVFSQQFLAITPSEDNWDLISEQCENLFEKYLTYASRLKERLDKKAVTIHKEGQNNYSKQQQKNTKTMKALSAYIGEDAAKTFVEKILFPVAK